MEQLQGFQNKFAKKVLGENVSSKEAMKTLKWLPLEYRRCGHRCELVQNAIKGNIPEHIDNFRSPLNSSRLTVVCETKWDETKWKWKSVVCEMGICSLRNGNLYFAKWKSVVCEMEICTLRNGNL